MSDPSGRTGIPGTAKATAATIRYRKSVASLGDAELGVLRAAFTSMEAITDDRGYGYWAGIHGLPLPISCTHGSPLFLPWHRAYLYYFEQYLMDQMPAGQLVSLPWWDWTSPQSLPPAYEGATLSGGSANPLSGAPITGIPDAQFNETNVPKATQTSRQPGPSGPGQGPNGLPSAQDVQDVLSQPDFMHFTSKLEDIHDQVHVWVGGTMSMIPLAAFDPIFWAHHTMIDRLWYLWQQQHPTGGVGSVPLDSPLGPFPTLNVSQTLSITTLGYDYAASESSAAGPG